MEENLITSGIIKMNQGDINEAAITYLTKKQTLLKTAISDYLINAKGYRVSSLVFNKQENGLMSVTAKVHTGQPISRPNQGFYDSLIHYLNQLKKKGTATADYDLVYEAMEEKYPTLSLSKFNVYLGDTRQQHNKGFKINVISGRGVKGDPYERTIELFDWSKKIIRKKITK